MPHGFLEVPTIAFMLCLCCHSVSKLQCKTSTAAVVVTGPLKNVS